MKCIREFFKRRFGYESELYPKFTDIERTDNLDAQILCTGFTKEMAKDLNVEFGIDDSASENDDEKDLEIQEENDGKLSNESVLKDIDSLAIEDAKEAKSHKFNKNEQQDVEKESETANSCKDFENCEEKDRLSDANSDVYSEDENERFMSRSVHSSTTTIHPDEIKKRIKRQMNLKEKRERRKKCVAKGEASAVTRSRRENTDTIKQSRGIWGWD